MEKLYSGLAGRWQSSFLAILHVYVFVIKMRYCQICVTVRLRLILGVVSFTDTLQVAREINEEEFPAWTGGRSFRPMIAGAIPDTGQVFGEDGCLTRPSTPISEEDKDQLIDAQPMMAGGSDQVSEDEDGAVIDPADNQPLGISQRRSGCSEVGSCKNSCEIAGKRHKGTEIEGRLGKLGKV